MGKGKKVEFVDEGLIFTFPEELIDIYVERLAHVPDSDLPKESGGFKPKRSVIQFRLYKKNTEKIPVWDFDKPFQLQVYFLPKDETSAGTVAKMQLGFHDGKIWKRFDSDKHGFSKFKYKKLKGKWRGYGKAKKIHSWPDPVMAWGP